MTTPDGTMRTMRDVYGAFIGAVVGACGAALVKMVALQLEVSVFAVLWTAAVVVGVHAGWRGRFAHFAGDIAGAGRPIGRGRPVAKENDGGAS